MHELNITQAFEEFKVSEIESVIQKEIDQGKNPLEIIKETQEAMEKIGKRFETGDYYLAELILAATMFQRVSKMLLPLIKGNGEGGVKTIGKIVLGTAKGDIHDLGKNIFGIMANAAGFQVVDIGVDATPSKFIEVVKKEEPQIVGISALITVGFQSMKEIVDLLVEEGIRGKVKVIIGGGAVGEQTRRFVGADAFTLDAAEGVRICKSILMDSNTSKKEH